MKKLRALREQSRQRQGDWARAVDEFAVAVLRVSEEGTSRSQIARALEVSTSTVQSWVNRGRQVIARG